MAACWLSPGRVVVAAPAADAAALPARVRRIVLHTLGGPFYRDPARRWVFYSPEETFALWRRPGFGAHWIVWTDGSLWPRHPGRGEPASVQPPVQDPADPAWRARLAREAAPVYAHVSGANAETVGIELAHSGRNDDSFPEAQVRSVAWLVRTLLEMSGGRLAAADVVGHKDLDDRPAYVDESCHRDGCAFYVDDASRPFRRRVDPPEALFTALVRFGVVISRSGSEGDRELLRAEAIPARRIPKTRR
jgi:hypothetical protein